MNLTDHSRDYTIKRPPPPKANNCRRSKQAYTSCTPLTYLSYRPHLLPPHLRLTLLEINDIGIHALGLRHEEPGRDRTGQITREEDPQHVRDTDLRGSGEVVEEDTREDGAELACGGADAVREAADAGGKDFAGDDEGGGVGAEIEEELFGGEDISIMEIGKGNEGTLTCAMAKQTNFGAVPSRW